jgi:drug/metabolite transporter (DMT)-like permease
VRAGIGLAVLAITYANLVGGVTYLWQKLAMAGLPPMTVTAGRNLIALVAMALWLGARGSLRFRYTRSEWVRLAIAGNLGYALPLTLGMWGVKWSTAANGSILVLLEPAAILILSWWLLSESIHRWQLIGAGVGLVGALVVVTEQAPLEGLFATDHLQGNILLATHGVLWATFTVTMKPLVTKLGRPMELTFVAMALAMVTLVPAALFEVDQWRAGPDLADAFMWMVWLGLLASFLGTVAWTWSLTHLKASAVAPFVFLQPIAGVLAGHLVLGEPVTPEALVGGALIGLGVLLVIAPIRRRAA